MQQQQQYNNIMMAQYQQMQMAQFQQMQWLQHQQQQYQQQYQQHQLAQYLAQQQQQQQQQQIPKAIPLNGKLDANGKDIMFLLQPLAPEHRQKNNRVTAVDQKLASCLRFIIANGHIDDFAEMLCQSEALRLLVIKQCSKNSSTHNSCLKWSKRWNLVQHPECAMAVYHIMRQQSRPKVLSPKIKSKDFIAGYHDLPLCTIDVMADVLFVDDAASFGEAREVLLAERVSLGIDLESMMMDFAIANAPKFCQIFTVATARKTVIFDLQELPRKHPKRGGGRIAAEAFNNLMSALFRDRSVIKIGMALGNDIANLTKQYPSFQCFQCVRNYLNLERVLKFIRSDRGRETFGVDQAVERRIRKLKPRESGLMAVVRHILKKRVDKKEQLSNWSLRPLRLSQLQYAAIDSSVSVEVYQKLLGFCQQRIPYHRFVSDILSSREYRH